jgi:hypothetical protein
LVKLGTSPGVAVQRHKESDIDGGGSSSSSSARVSLMKLAGSGAVAILIHKECDICLSKSSDEDPVTSALNRDVGFKECIPMRRAAAYIASHGGDGTYFGRRWCYPPVPKGAAGTCCWYCARTLEMPDAEDAQLVLCVSITKAK